MVVAVAVITGFKHDIKEKVVGFGSHIRIVNYDSNQSLETTPIPDSLECLREITNIPGIRHIQKFAVKAGIIKTDTDIQGVVLKGVASDFDWNFFARNLVEGDVLHLTDSVISKGAVISATLASMLNLKIGDRFDMFFIQNPPRFRRFTVKGIYNSRMPEFDRVFVLCDLRHIQRLNGWPPDRITGFEILVDNINRIEQLAWVVDDIAGVIFTPDGARLRVESIMDRYPNIFDWLGLQDLNAAVLIILMLLVAGINMISGLLIIILERTGTIGLLKALGADNSTVRRLFFIQSAYIMLRGLLIGTLVGLALCFVQHHFGIAKLDEEFYFLSVVPVRVIWWHVAILNVLAFMVGLLMLVAPSMVISRITPEETLKFE